MRDAPGRIDRREAIRRVGAAAAAPLLGGLYHPLVPVQEGARWEPVVFDARELATVTELSEVLIPRTETPGAKDALVHQYVDFVLGRDSEDARARFLQGLERLELRSRERFEAGFTEIEPAARAEIVRELAGSAEGSEGRRFFEDARSRTIEGYYRSEAGMMEELGFQGNTYVAEFEGCTHPEHLEFRPRRRDREEDAAADEGP